MNNPRIIAGVLKGRKLVSPAGQDTRPTNIRARQAVFDILAHAAWCDLRGAKVLDVFAGTGAYGLEALSRGAAFATFIEQAPIACAAIQQNIAGLALDNAKLIKADALTPPLGEKQDLVFLDPPYGKALLEPAIEALQRMGWICAGTVLIAEFGPQDEMQTPIQTLLASRTHGKAQLKIWQV